MPSLLVAVNPSPIMAAGHRQPSEVCSRPDGCDTMSTNSGAGILLTSCTAVSSLSNTWSMISTNKPQTPRYAVLWGHTREMAAFTSWALCLRQRCLGACFTCCRQYGMARPRGCMDAISQPAANGNRDTRSAGHDCRTASQPPDDHKRERVNKFRHNYCVDIRSDEVGRHIA